MCLQYVLNSCDPLVSIDWCAGVEIVDSTVDAAGETPLQPLQVQQKLRAKQIMK